mgnify:CR=1 FL=1
MKYKRYYIAWGKDKSESRVTAEFDNCAVEVMRGAEAIDTYIALPQQEAFDIEYWLLEEAKHGRQLLEYLGLRDRKSLDLIACPSCGRAEVDVIKVASEAQSALENEGLPIQVAVMGCVVNGPGEARSADIGIAAGKKRGHLFIKGEVVKVVDEKDMVSALLEEGRLLAEEGIEARLAAADKDAALLAQQDAEELMGIQGDINNFEERTKSVIEITSNQDKPE